MKISRFALAALTLPFLHACNSSGDSSGTFTLPANYPLPGYANTTRSGGDTSDLDASRGSGHAFSTPAANLTDEELELHLEGDAAFELAFVRAPHEEHPELDGVGPAFNVNSCTTCHQRDGRATPPQADAEFTKLGSAEGLFLRISLANDDCTPELTNRYCASVPVPGFSDQLHHRGVVGLRDDSIGTGLSDVYARRISEDFQYPDGEIVQLSHLEFEIRNPYDQIGAVPSRGDTLTSRLYQDDVRSGPRIGLPVFGLGLLEAITEADILNREDPEDRDGDGISGRANRVYDPVKAQNGISPPQSLGRFGWKANEASVFTQSMGAFNKDMGLTTTLFPTESIANTVLHDQYLLSNPEDTGMDSQGLPEVDDDLANAVSFYVSSLHVPARRNTNDADVLQGAKLFEFAGCQGCHVAQYTTGSHDSDAFSGQNITPYTDMLLHDMGPELADGRTDFLATGREWKTRPLWGIGFTHLVNSGAGFLHDGRARTIEEAILWHGGEAATSNENFQTMSKDDREALIAFLNSL